MTHLPTPPNFRLDNKLALVMGASSGIGAGCAVALAEAGAEVVLAARRKPELDELVLALKKKGLHARAKVLDIADVHAMQTYIQNEVVFDILVNSAGVARNNPAATATVEDFDAVMAVNLRGAYFLTQAVAQRLIQANQAGSLINISSQMGIVGGIDRSIYCASKHGMEGFTKAMAIEFGTHKIRVNTVCPTFVRTPLTEKILQDPAKIAWIQNKIKLERLGKVEDVMGAVVYLASDAASLVTGSALLVDGGWTAG